MQSINQLIKRRWFQTMMVGIICFLLGCGFSYLLVYHSIDIQEQRNLEQMKLLEPNISVELSEINENQLKIIVSSMDENRSGINDFFFEFELPGIFRDITVKREWRVNGCSITSAPDQQGHFNSTLYIPDKIRLYIKCESISPFGYYVAIINYLPTKPTNWVFGNHTYVTMPLMDLRDYQEYRYSWKYNGQNEDRNGCVNLSNLGYIKKDNENMISEYGFFRDMSSLIDYEENIRNKIC